MPRKKASLAREASTPVGKPSGSGKVTVRGIPVTPAGRPSRSCASVTSYDLTPTRRTKASPANPIKEENPQKTLVSRPRGRPPKATTAAAAVPKPSSAATSVKTEQSKPGRGRPKKSTTSTIASSHAVKDVVPSPKRKRTDDDPDVEQPPAKRRGRPPKDATPSVPAKPKKYHAVKVEKESKKDIKTTTKASKKTTEAKTRKSRTPKNADKVSSAEELEAQLLEHESNEGTQYWLMKAEPDTRIVSGIDVAFPIDKLAAATDPEPWDGVRNPVARNHMRAMRKGDLAFFYHSNCSIPAVVGAMRIVEEHAPDESAFDPNHPYFDVKSKREAPKWDCVKVEFVKKFDNPVTLKALKADPELTTMQIAQNAYGRLSVQTVTPAQWLHVLKMAGEPDDVGVLPATSGYEADTNGETDKEGVEDSVGIDDVDAVKLAAYGDAVEFSDDEEEDTTGTTPHINGAKATEATTVKLSTGVDDDDDGPDDLEDSNED